MEHKIVDEAICRYEFKNPNTQLIRHNEGKIVPIDFSLSGYSYIYMDLGSLLCQFTRPEENKAIIAGYESIWGHKVDMYFVEPFYAMQVLLFIACQHNKSYECEWFAGAVKRCCDTIFTPLSRKVSFLAQCAC